MVLHHARPGPAPAAKLAHEYTKAARINSTKRSTGSRLLTPATCSWQVSSKRWDSEDIPEPRGNVTSLSHFNASSQRCTGTQKSNVPDTASHHQDTCGRFQALRNLPTKVTRFSGITPLNASPEPIRQNASARSASAGVKPAEPASTSGTMRSTAITCSKNDHQPQPGPLNREHRSCRKLPIYAETAIVKAILKKQQRYNFLFIMKYDLFWSFCS